MADAPDALDVMRRSMIASHNAAAAEAKKGKRASAVRVAELLNQAADMAARIAAIEDRRGLTAPPADTRIDVRVIPSLRGLTADELKQMQSLILKTHAALA